MCIKVVKTIMSYILTELLSLPKSFTSKVFADAHNNLVIRVDRQLPLIIICEMPTLKWIQSHFLICRQDNKDQRC